MLAYDILGSGPGLILLPGIGGSATDTWEALSADLAVTHTVVLADLPGSSRGRLPSGPLQLEVLADQVVATARQAGLRNFVIAGTSLGAAVAVKVAARHPDRVRGLFTLAGFARPRTTLWLSLEMWASLHAHRDDKLSAFVTSVAFSEDYLADLTPEAARRLTARLVASAPGAAQQIALALRTDLRADLPSITAPTLVVSATGDRLVAPEHSVELAEGIPGARLAAVRGGHAATIEEPGRTLEILAGFLRDIRRTRSADSATLVLPRPANPDPQLLPTSPQPRNPHRC
ncbi:MULTISPECIES: alpha/beta fold hydrolase [Streptomyces]|uniref:alpha/beta fold hydrolase n=1 Tax=Streptomyces TaxID=1883 RepID=UPI0023DCF37F|nr:alpha/beta fold hydrolase [Streptomyces sp. FXJ1.172]WEP00566.1 alpha/beta fold hydrolase [Streptomyces sp. FXJ1.172]